MKLIVGLGNPGKQYAGTRHNVGFMVIESLERRRGAGGSILAKPPTFVNDSGPAVAKKLARLKLKPPNLYLVHDDLDIALGKFKLQFGRGPKIHAGVQSVEKALGTSRFWRLRLGIENRGSSPKIPGQLYVLEKFPAAEAKILAGVIEEAASKLYEVTKADHRRGK